MKKLLTGYNKADIIVETIEKDGITIKPQGISG